MLKSKLAKLRAAILDLKRVDELAARRVAAMPNRYYGHDVTIRQESEINIETRAGKVVACWFRCQMLPFSQIEVNDQRAAVMVFLQPQVAIVGVELTDTQ